MKNSQKRWAHIKNWPKLWRNHIGQGGKGWLWFAAAVFAPLAPWTIYLSADPEHQEAILRVAGMLLQLVGFIIALMGIEGSLRFAGAPTVARSLLNYAAGFVTTLRNKTTVLTAMGVASGTSVARVSATVKPGNDATIERRVLLLESNLEHMQKTVWDQNKKIDKLELSLNEETKKISEELKFKTKELRNHIDTFQIANAQQEFVGILFFAFGVIYSTIPEFVLKAIDWILA